MSGHNQHTQNLGLGSAVPPTSVKFTADDLVRVDALASARGLTRSEWIRRRATTTGAASATRKDADKRAVSVVGK
jgi:hypothetical protein